MLFALLIPPPGRVNSRPKAPTLHESLGRKRWSPLIAAYDKSVSQVVVMHALTRTGTLPLRLMPRWRAV